MFEKNGSKHGGGEKDQRKGCGGKNGKKKRVLLLCEQRNGMINSNLGDKTFKNVDNSLTFLKKVD